VCERSIFLVCCNFTISFHPREPAFLNRNDQFEKEKYIDTHRDLVAKLGKKLLRKKIYICLFFHVKSVVWWPSFDKNMWRQYRRKEMVRVCLHFSLSFVYTTFSMDSFPTLAFQGYVFRQIKNPDICP
jgi:hypothetical protein